MIPYTVTDIIPQRPPFVMVDELITCNDHIAVTCFTVRDTNIFVASGVLAEAALLENMAQSCAAWVGYYNFLCQQNVQIGVVGGMKNVKIFHQLHVNDTMETSITKTMDVFFNNMIVFFARIVCKNVLIAEGELKVALLPDETT